MNLDDIFFLQFDGFTAETCFVFVNLKFRFARLIEW